MNKKCEIVKDLLPLYKDGICSEESMGLVREHLNECKSCASLYQTLQNTTYEDSLQLERDVILKKHAAKERKRAVTIGSSIAGVLMIPVIICLICNLAIGHSLDWFFIVVASLLVLASITVVPFLVPDKKGTITILTFTCTLILLFLVCCIYTGGSWFFIATLSTLLGMSVLFLPYVLYNLPLPKALNCQKGLLTMAIDTLLLFGVILVCGLGSPVTGYWQTALPITAFSILLPWALFLIIRYIKINVWFKSSVCSIITGFYLGFMNDFIGHIVEGRTMVFLRQMDFTNWSTPDIVTSNVDFIMFLTCLFIGFVLFGIGMVRKHQ